MSTPEHEGPASDSPPPAEPGKVYGQREPNRPVCYVALERKIDGRLIRYEAEAPTAQEAHALLYMIQGGPPTVEAADETAALREDLRKAIADIGQLERDLATTRYCATHPETTEYSVPRARYAEAEEARAKLVREIAALKNERDRLRAVAGTETQERALATERVMELTAELSNLTKMAADATESHGVAEAKWKLERDDLIRLIRDLLEGAGAPHVNCFGCGASNSLSHTSRCPVVKAERFLERSTTDVQAHD